MSFTSPYFVEISLMVRSGTSGCRLAILILIPIPAFSVCTWDNSPLSCLNSSVPTVSRSTFCIRMSFANLMKTRRRGPSYVFRPPVAVSRGSIRVCVKSCYTWSPLVECTHDGVLAIANPFLLSSLLPHYTLFISKHSYYLPTCNLTAASSLHNHSTSRL